MVKNPKIGEFDQKTGINPKNNNATYGLKLFKNQSFKNRLIVPTKMAYESYENRGGS